jgi:hypothetical protein
LRKRSLFAIATVGDLAHHGALYIVMLLIYRMD